MDEQMMYIYGWMVNKYTVDEYTNIQIDLGGWVNKWIDG